MLAVIQLAFIGQKQLEFNEKFTSKTEQKQFLLIKILSFDNNKSFYYKKKFEYKSFGNKKSFDYKKVEKVERVFYSETNCFEIEILL